MMRQLIISMILIVITFSGCTDKDIVNNTSKNVEPTPGIAITEVQVFPVSEPSTVFVDIKGTMFIPLELKITNGTTVRWRNLDSTQYILNVNGHQSPILNKQNTWNFTFNRSGIFEIKCSLHPSIKSGRIIVE